MERFAETTEGLREHSIPKDLVFKVAIKDSLCYFFQIEDETIYTDPPIKQRNKKYIQQYEHLHQLRAPATPLLC
ncbi:hypothetical protein CRE_09312 [Caenorhabditis remanei]|uniref:Uncharacterized protein n=1 Tax=Caenorhabditis remanei TaxID=31234 RepID=E3LI38_CAERE|nr:hypothetical protein CRE_09312 [Caenorhabditis remanei]